MRKLWYVVIGLVILFLIVVFAVPAFVNVNKYHDKIQAELEQKLDRKVTLGNMSLRIIPLSVKVADATIGEDPNFHTGRPFATAQDLSVSVKFFPLLAGNIEVNSINLVNPKVELVRNPQGAWNFSTIGKEENAPAPTTTAKNTPKNKPTPANPPEQPSTNKNAGPAQSLSIAELKITNGQVAITDEQKHQSRAVYDNIDLDLSNFAPGQPFDLSLAAHLPGTGDQYVKFDGKAGPLNSQNSLNTPVDGRLTLNQVSLAGIQKFLNSPQLSQYQATATGEASVRNHEGTMSSTGNIDLTGVRVKGVDIGYPIKTDYDVSDDLNNDLIKISKANINFGPTPISITGELNAHPTPAQLNVQVKASNASISELAKLAGAFGVAFNPGTQVAGTLNADIHAQGSSSQPALNGTLKADNLVISGKDMPQSVKIPAIDLALTPDVVRSNNFTAQSGSTSLMANFAMSHYTTPNSAIDATIKTTGANIGELINIAKAYGVSAVEGMSGSGSLSLDARVQGPLKQPERMTYTGTGSIQNASLSTPNLTKPVLIHTANLKFAQNSAVLENLQASLGSTNATGTATVKNFSAPQIQFNVNADKLNIGELEQITSGKSATKTAENHHPFSLVPSAYAEGRSGGDSGISHITGTGALHVGSIIFDQLALSNFQSNLNFSGDPAGNLMRTLNGDIKFDTGNGKFQGVDLLHELASIAKFTQFGQSSQGFTNIIKLGGLINVKNGLASTNNLEAVIDGGTLGAQGTVDLVSEILNMHVNAVLGKALSDKVGGTGIGGFMQTALANKSGELVIPVIVTGTMNHPVFAPDLQKIAQMKLNGLLPTTGNPGQLVGGLLGGKTGGQAGAVSGILGALTGKKNQQQGAQQQQQQQQNPVNQILGAFGKPKKK